MTTTWNGPGITRDITAMVRGAIVINDPNPEDDDGRVTVEVPGFLWDRFVMLARHVDGSEPRS